MNFSRFLIQLTKLWKNTFILSLLYGFFFFFFIYLEPKVDDVQHNERFLSLTIRILQIRFFEMLTVKTVCQGWTKNAFIKDTLFEDLGHIFCQNNKQKNGSFRFFTIFLTSFLTFLRRWLFFSLMWLFVNSIR